MHKDYVRIVLHFKAVFHSPSESFAEKFALRHIFRTLFYFFRGDDDNEKIMAYITADVAMHAYGRSDSLCGRAGND